MTTKKEIKDKLLTEGITCKEEGHFTPELSLFKKSFSEKRGSCFATFRDTDLLRFYETFKKSGETSFLQFIKNAKDWLKEEERKDRLKPEEENRFIFSFEDYEDYINDKKEIA